MWNWLVIDGVVMLLALYLYNNWFKHWLGLNPGRETDPSPVEGGRMPSRTYLNQVGKGPTTMAQLPITQATIGVAFTANTVNLLTDVYVYTVPRATVVHFKPTDFFAALLQTAVPAAILATSLWELVVRDPTARESKVLTGGTYAQLASFTDSTLKKYLGVIKEIGPERVIAIRVNATTVIATANSNFLLTAMQEYGEE